MITEIAVKNFKTLRDVTIPLAPGITVMVGANNSGKSNALAVLKLLAEVSRQGTEAAVQALGGWKSVLSREEDSPLGINAKVRFAGVTLSHSLFEAGDVRYSLENATEVEDYDWERPRQEQEEQLLKQLGFFLKATTVHDLSVPSLRKPALVHRDASMGPDGLDTAAVLDKWSGETPSLRDEIDKVVRSAAREVKRVITRLGPEPGTKVLGVEEADGRVYGAEDMSDGLLLFIGLAVAAQLKARTPCILAIEEPERGIHPRRLRELLDHLLRLTQSGVQVVLTTHSPTLLDEFRDSPESVLIFERDEQGTHITRLSDRPDWEKELKGAPLGELWYSGVLGGVPSR
ncbi:AAA family ATPase [Stigmatella hybrida]|uniref:AAA family ATPase n=1 Tax=Stigmatella hybrida TaxID=394097 RepID=UPI001CDB1A54|nr:ATP-binding protein [Stigmatella hybrida]